MKANLLVIDARAGEPSPDVEALCSALMDDYYVYLMCPGCGFREDNPHGVRFLSNDYEAPPAFGELAAILSFADREALAPLLRSGKIPGRFVHLNPRGSHDLLLEEVRRRLRRIEGDAASSEPRRAEASIAA